MNRFMQLHLLTSYPPSNLNRDDLGRPKTAEMGGATRLRISSQSLKRAWRTSQVFEEAAKGHVGTRTKEMGRRICERLIKGGVAEKKARAWSRKIAEQFGKAKGSKDDGKPEWLEIEQLAHFSPEEIEQIEALADTLIERGSEPTEEELELLREKPAAADIALFGRMLAAKPKYNVEAAAQVAHAITIHQVAVEDDFFTAVDDLNEGIEDVGAGHMGETEFGAGLFYLYICVDRQSLLDNLGGDESLAQRTLAALVEAVVKVSPTGKQNSFASRAYASFALCETGDQQPRSLSVAFLEPVRGTKLLEEGVKRLLDTRDRMNEVYGPCADQEASLNVLSGEGSLAEVIECATR
jgi:CRISPR system Cascade subunit CasC